MYGLEKGDLKEIGVTSMGRRLEMFAKITELLHGQGGKVGDKSGDFSVLGEVCSQHCNFLLSLHLGKKSNDQPFFITLLFFNVTG